MLIALGKGDRYRLMHIRETLERGKELYISDKGFLQNLVSTHLKDRIYQARVVSTLEKPKQFCENCASEISADEMFCTNCGATTQASSSPPTLDVPEPTLKPKKKSRQQELEEYEKKYLNESETNVSWKAYDVKAKRKVEIQNPKAVKMKNGKWAVKGTSPITGIKVFRIVGNEKPAVSSEKDADSQKVKKEPATPAEKPKGSQKTEPEVFSRYYRSPEAESP